MLIAAGGCDRWNCLDSIEEYDPRTDVWRQIAVLKTARRGCAVAVVNGK
jgi:influenza virus NS1A-binding protein